MQDCHFCKLLISEMMPNHLTSENNEQQSQDLGQFVFWNTIALFECVNNFHCGDSWSTANPLLTPPGELIYFKPIWGGGGLIWEGDLPVFNLEIKKTIVSVLHKELEYKVVKLENKKVGGDAAKDQNQIWASSR